MDDLRIDRRSSENGGGVNEMGEEMRRVEVFELSISFSLASQEGAVSQLGSI